MRERDREVPAVSVIMPVRNEEAFIGRSLGALLRQTYPRDHLEVIVADGRSADRTREIVRDIQAAHPHDRIRLMDNPQQIFSTGFNLSLGEAHGDVIIMLGGHTIIADDYVERCVDHLLAHGEFDCVGGYMATVGMTAVSEVIALALGSSFGVGGVAFRTKPGLHSEVDTVAFGAYRRSAILRCGFLDEELVHNQDDDYNYRLRDQGGRILLTPDIRATYYSRSSLRSLAKQYFFYGYWKVRVMQKHPRQMRLRHFVPPLFAGALLAGTLLTVLLPPAAPGLVLLAGVYGAAVVMTSGRLMLRSRPRYGPLLLLIFPLLHLNYGLGFLAGLVRFAHRWGAKRDQDRRVAGCAEHAEGGVAG